MLIQEATASGARLQSACKEAGISMRTYRRWYQRGEVQQDKRPDCLRPTPANKLTTEEQKEILAVCNEPQYANLPPTQIVPTLLDNGVYYASESSFYRLLKQTGQLAHRGRAHAPKNRKTPTTHRATTINQIWTWDITYLSSPIKGQYYYLYLFLDIYSRKIVGYEVHEKECGTLASELVQRCVLKEHCTQQPLVLHSDNGAPMKARTMKAKLEELGILSSYSRPRVSNDNPFSEALFRTLKYKENWPSAGFTSLADARDWVQQFADWYNNQHKHSELRFVSPAERHAGLDTDILAKRKRVLEVAKNTNPNRWSGNVRNCEPIGTVFLNPDRLENIGSEMAG